MGGAATHPEQPKPLQTQISPPHHPQSNRRGDSHGVHFGKGSLVEVRPDEEGFREVYFSATVIQSSTSSSKRGSKRKPKGLYVEYENLLAREDGSERLREYVDPAFIRPAPPFHETIERFELDDAVEAFCREGWWIGVVSRVLEGGQRYRVTFENPPDELELGLAELRARWDWVDGSWVLPVKQSKAGLMFDVGRKVEVSFDREDSQAAWFTANVCEDLGNGAFLVEYCRADADNKPLTHKVTTDLLHLRPCPPLLKNKSFDLFAKVDAFFDYGWWSGLVTRALEDSRYNVFFKEMRKDMIFDLSELRPHMEWKDGKWFTSSQLSQDASGDDAVHEHLTPDNSRSPVSTVSVCNSGERKDISNGKTHSSFTPDVERLTQDNQKISPAASSPVKRTRKSYGSKKRVPQPVKKLKEGSLVGPSEQETPERSVKESSSSSLSTVSASVSATEAAKGNLSSNNPSWGKRIRRKSRMVDAIQSAGEMINSTSSSVKNTSTEIVLHEAPEVDIGGKADAVEKTAENAKNEHGKEGTPVIIGLPCAEIGSSGKSRGKRGLSSNGKERNLDGRQSDNGKVRGRKKRGSTGRISIDIIQTPFSESAQNGVVVSDKNGKADNQLAEVEVMDMEPSLPNQEKLSDIKDKLTNSRSSESKTKKGSIMKRKLKLLEEKVSEESIKLQDLHPLKRGKRRLAGEKVALLEKPTADAEKAVCESANNEFDDEPLSKWIEAKQSSFIIDISKMSAVNTTEKCKENGKKQGNDVLKEQSEKQQPERGTQASTSSIVEVPLVPIEHQGLPFSKNTILWKTIESMEIFKKFPQKPHFQPLEQCKESSREGLAIGYMVTFSSVVEKTSKLQFGDPKSVTDDILETLVDLERHGFDVSFIRDRVNELLAVRDKQEKLVGETRELDTQISKENQEKNKIEEEMKAINEGIKKLQEKLAVAELGKKKKNDNIALLQATLKEKKETIKNAGRDFETIASSTML